MRPTATPWRPAAHIWTTGRENTAIGCTHKKSGTTSAGSEHSARKKGQLWRHSLPEKRDRVAEKRSRKIIKDFAKERLVYQPIFVLSKAQIYQEYLKFCEKTGSIPRKTNPFFHTLNAYYLRGKPTIRIWQKHQNYIVVPGLQLKNPILTHETHLTK
jgi:hypothetical protein